MVNLYVSVFNPHVATTIIYLTDGEMGLKVVNYLVRVHTIEPMFKPRKTV